MVHGRLRLVSAPRRDPFVGRDHELGVLSARLAAASEGRGGAVFLVGEPGMGKTRTAFELARHARDEGAEVLVGRCYEGEGAPPFWPWVQILRAYARSRDAATLADELGAAATDIAAISPELRMRLPDLAKPPLLEPAAARFRFFDGVAGALSRAATSRPVVVVLDDLQGADEPSLLLLTFLARAIGEMRVLVVGTLRTRALAREHPLAQTLGELAREQAVDRITLAGLSESEVAELLELEQVAGGAPPPGLAASVHARTEGNPLYVREVARMLASAGGLAAVRGGGPIDMPDTVRLAIGRNLSALSKECRELLTLASLLGREFWVGALARASGCDPNRVLDLLDEAEAARIAVPLRGEPAHWRFAHALFGETLAEDLSSAARAALHRQAAEALATDERASDHAAEIAHHWMQAGPAGDPDQAVAWACRAAERALGLLAHEEAERLYRLALAALDSHPHPNVGRRVEVLLGLGEACKRAGETPQSKRAFLEAAALGRKLASPELLTRAALGFAPPIAFAEQPEADAAVVGLLEDAIEAWDGRDSGLHACALVRLALARFFGDAERNSRLIECAVAMARRTDEPATLRYVLAGTVATSLGPNDPERRLALASDLVQLAEEAGDLQSLAVGRLWRGVHLLEASGDAAGMRREQKGLARVAAELDQPVWSWYARVTEGAVALLEGRFEDAEQSALEALRVGQPALPYAARGYFLCSMLNLRHQQGRPSEFASECRALLEAHPSPLAISPLAWAESERGNAAEAQRIVERLAAVDLAEWRQDPTWLLAISFLAEAFAFLRDEARAARLYELIAPLRRGWVMWAEAVPRGPFAHYLGLLARTVGRLDEAAAHFEDALASAARAGAPPFLARAQYEYALLLRSRGAPGDAERAASLLADAQATAGAIGMAGLLAKIAALAKRAPPTSDEAEAQIFRREGEFWTIAYAGQVIRLRDMRGLHYLETLLRHPGREFHASELAAAGTGHRALASVRDESLRVVVGLGDAGELLDARARAAYRQRLADLAEQLAEAERRNDLGRLEQARAEREALVAELCASARGRRVASQTERARIAVTKAIKLVLKKIAASHPPLGAHLAATIRRGYFCAYLPDPRQPTDWAG